MTVLPDQPDLPGGLGRRPAPDPQDRAYRMRAILQPIPAEIAAKGYRYYRSGQVLDQGVYPHCVGYSWRAFLDAAPLMTLPAVGPTARTIYTQAQERDEWPGTAYAGTSVRAGVKYLRELGYIAAYYWSWAALTIGEFILADQGTVVLGVNWYRDMLLPDEQGVIGLGGPLMGGHAILCVGYNKNRGLFRLQNSWGRAWGQNGRCWLSGEDLDRLLHEDGEACTASEQRLAPT